jgi:hypothetical protein
MDSEKIRLTKKREYIDQIYEQIENRLGFLGNSDMEYHNLWKLVATEKFDEKTLPQILKTVMAELKSTEYPNWVKRKIAVAILSVGVETYVPNKSAQNALNNLIPFLIDTFSEIAKSKNLFKNKKSYCICK